MIKEYGKWLEKTKDVGYLFEELDSIKGKDKEIEDRFFRHLEFGTGGIRGVLGAGTNRMNIFTIKRASKGFANFLNANEGHSVAIAYDSRNFSKEFAHESAAVFASNGIKTYIFETLQPTPVLSYAVRALKCDAGVMVTASHNPAKYNGYKAYGADGCQITAEIAASVTDEINAITDYFSVKTESFDKLLKEGKIAYIEKSVYDGFINEVLKLSVGDDSPKKLKIVYSPLNGTGNIPVREVFSKRGYNDVTVVKEQEMPDGNFTTCSFPNPEEKAAMNLGIELAKKTGADLLLATDPDCDRVGIAVKNGGDYVLISGNETGLMLSQYLLEVKKQRGTLPKKPVIVKTIVTSDLIFDIAKDYGADVYNLLTGFKYIGELISGLSEKGEDDRYIFGFEESYGYLSGTHVRDKDAVNASMLIADMAEYYLSKGKTLYEALTDLYKKYGYAKSYLKNIEFLGAAGLKDMNAKLAQLRANPIKTLAGEKVTEFKDYAKGIDNLPASDVLSFKTDNFKVLARPSGTEPKLKIYIMIKAGEEEKLQPAADKIIAQMTALFE